MNLIEALRLHGANARLTRKSPDITCDQFMHISSNLGPIWIEKHSYWVTNLDYDDLIADDWEIYEE